MGWREWRAETIEDRASHAERVRAGYVPDESAGQRCKAGKPDGLRVTQAGPASPSLIITQELL